MQFFKNTVLYNCHENSNLIVIIRRTKQEKKYLIGHAIFWDFQTLLFYLFVIKFILEITIRLDFTCKTLKTFKPRHIP